MAGIAKQDLIDELTSLSQQEMRCEQEVTAARRAAEEAETRLASIRGAMQLARHLLNKAAKREKEAAAEPVTGAATPAATSVGSGDESA